MSLLQINADALTTQISRLINVIERQIKRLPTPIIFIQSNNNSLSSNVATGIMIQKSPPIRHGQRGVVRDLNINFTTVAGTIRIVKVDAQETVLVDITRGIAASQSGIGAVVLEEGESIAVVGQTAGAGTFGLSFSGEVVNIE